MIHSLVIVSQDPSIQGIFFTLSISLKKVNTESMTENWEHFICKGTANISLLTFYDDRSQNVPAFPATNLKWLRGIAELTTTIQHHKFITRHLADTLPGYLSTLRALLCILNMTRPSQLSLQDTVQWVGRLADNLVFRGPIPDLFPFFMLKLILNVKKSVGSPRVSRSVHTPQVAEFFVSVKFGDDVVALR